MTGSVSVSVGVPSAEAAYVVAAWSSWLLPLAAYEIVERFANRRPVIAAAAPHLRRPPRRRQTENPRRLPTQRYRPLARQADCEEWRWGGTSVQSQKQRY